MDTRYGGSQTRRLQLKLTLAGSGVSVSEEQLIALAMRAESIADRAYESRMQIRYRIEKSLQRIRASLALLARLRP